MVLLILDAAVLHTMLVQQVWFADETLWSRKNVLLQLYIIHVRKCCIVACWYLVSKINHGIEY